MIMLFVTLGLCGCSDAGVQVLQTEKAEATPTPTKIPTETSVPLPTPSPTCPPEPTPTAAPIPCHMFKNPYSSLSVPTQITKIGEDYFLVDCYHNQILTSTSLDKPLEEWYVITDQINRGHTIAGNGSVFLADDTENNRILVFQKNGADFVLTKVFDNIGDRPHYVEYHPVTERFYVLSSMSGELFVFYQENASSEIYLEQVLNIPDMQNVYIRSFTIDGDEIYFAASNGTILRNRLENLEPLEQWTLPDELAGLVQVTFIDDFFYLTISTDKCGNAEYANIIRTRDLSYLQDYGYDDLYDTFAGAGTPYYISSFDEHYYLTQHCNVPGHGVWQFDIADEEICNVISLYP